jgi:NADH dehydrogenase FAD-containing subunit
MKKQLVLLGGGHAHMMTLARLHLFIDQGYEVTVVQPSPYHYYSGMGPGLLGGTYQGEQIRFDTRTKVQRAGGRFLLDRACRIDPLRQRVLLAHAGNEIGYNVLSCNVGSFVEKTAPQQGAEPAGFIFPVKPIEGLLQLQQKLVSEGGKKRLVVGVIGDGPSAVEVAGNLVQLGRIHKFHDLHVQIFSGRGLLNNDPGRVRQLTSDILARQGVVVNPVRIINYGPKTLVDDQGKLWPVDLAIVATGVSPSPLFRDSDIWCGPSGGLLVNGFLQSVQYVNIFGGGDCIDFAPRLLPKVGVMAVRENPVLFHNLMAALRGTPLRRFYPGGKFLQIYNLGNKEGLFAKGCIAFSGRIAFMIKDEIDRRFMRIFR